MKGSVDSDLVEDIGWSLDPGPVSGIGLSEYGERNGQDDGRTGVKHAAQLE